MSPGLAAKPEERRKLAGGSGSAARNIGNCAALSAYNGKEDIFSACLALGIHFSASGFAKAPESMSLSFCDFARQRSIREIKY
jgi:hypothetical protein